MTNGSPRAFVEHFRLDPSGRFLETQYRLVSRDGGYSGDYYDNGTLYDTSPGRRRDFYDNSYPRGYDNSTRREYESPFFAPPRREDPRYRSPSLLDFFNPPAVSRQQQQQMQQQKECACSSVRAGSILTTSGAVSGAGNERGYDAARTLFRPGKARVRDATSGFPLAWRGCG